VGITLYDCPWCGSAKSIEHGLCQVCLMEFPMETKVIALPMPRPVIDLTPLAAPEAAGAE
jgi:hypothetical protein